MRSFLSLPSLPGSLLPGKVTPDRVLSMAQTDLFEIELFLNKTIHIMTFD